MATPLTVHPTNGRKLATRPWSGDCMNCACEAACFGNFPCIVSEVGRDIEYRYADEVSPAPFISTGHIEFCGLNCVIASELK